MSCTSPSHLIPRSMLQFGLRYCPYAILCAGCIFHTLEWVLIFLHTIILHNRMMCHANHAATYSQGHSLDSKQFLSAILCLDCIFHMLERILILLHTTIPHNKMMCHAHHPATYFQGQAHSFDSNNFLPQFHVCSVSSTCLNRF